jgi:ATP-dependent Clp protease ATP-binding subunit ClpA
LTSGRGDRVYFSEAFIIFTSNLGIYRTDASGERVPNVSPHEPASEVARKVRAEIDRHFKAVLNRPEILNRIGENILVFDFIRPEIAEDIFQGMVSGVLENAEQVGIRVDIAPPVRDQLARLCLSDLSNGGRGIRNQIETHLVNPLSRALFDSDAQIGSRWRVISLHSTVPTSLTLEAK